jgi:hypothetical protein
MNLPLNTYPVTQLIIRGKNTSEVDTRAYNHDHQRNKVNIEKLRK